MSNSLAVFAMCMGLGLIRVGEEGSMRSEENRSRDVGRKKHGYYHSSVADRSGTDLVFQNRYLSDLSKGGEDFPNLGFWD